MREYAAARRPKRRPKVEPEHGTTPRYRRGCRCEECTRANREYQRQLCATLTERMRNDPASVPHGTTNGYRAYGCRCDACSAVHKAACADYNERRRAVDRRRLGKDNPL